MENLNSRQDILFNTCMNMLKERTSIEANWLVSKIGTIEGPQDLSKGIRSFMTSCIKMLKDGDQEESVIELNGEKIDLMENFTP